jgi:carboxypeptidase Taq
LMVLRRWLAQKIHRWGRMFPPEHLSQRVTGISLSPEPFLRYIDRKYGDLYHL